MRILIYTIGFLALSHSLFSQKNIHDYVNNADTSRVQKRIIDVTPLWTFFVPITSKKTQLTIANHKTKHTIVLLPNSKTAIGLNVIHKWFGIGISFGLSQSKNDIERFGKTSQFDLQINSYLRSMVFDFHIQAYKGFYQSEVPPDAQGIFPQAPNLSTYSIGGNLLFFTNKKKFSYRAAYSHSAIQLKSAGSFNYGFYIDIDGAKNPDAFSSLNLSKWPKEFNLVAYNSGGFGLIAGYSYTFVIRKFFFINFSLSPKLGIRYLTYRQSNGKHFSNIISSGGAIIRFSIGYEGKYLFYGFSGVSQSNTYAQKGYEIEPVTFNTKLFIGTRF